MQNLIEKYFSKYGVEYEIKSINEWQNDFLFQEVTVEHKFHPEESFYLRHDLLVVSENQLRRIPLKYREEISCSISFVKRIKTSTKNFQYYKTKYGNIAVVQYFQKMNKKEIIVFQ